MPAIRLVLLAFVVITACACGTDPAPRAYSLAVVGCGVAEVHPSSDSRSTALDATVSACPGVADPVARVARAVWLSRSGGTESLRIRVAGPTSAATVLSRTELTETYGEFGRRGPTSTSFLWLLLLLLPPAAAGVVGLLARGFRSGTVVLLTSR